MVLMKVRKTLMETEDDGVGVGRAKRTDVLCVMGGDEDASNHSSGTSDVGFVKLLSTSMTPR